MKRNLFIILMSIAMVGVFVTGLLNNFYNDNYTFAFNGVFCFFGLIVLIIYFTPNFNNKNKNNDSEE